MRFHDEEQAAPKSVNTLEQDFPKWKRVIARADSTGHRYTTFVFHFSSLNGVRQEKCDKRNHAKARHGRGQCELVYRAANLIPCYVVATTVETLNVQSHDGVSDVRLRLSKFAVPCGNPRQLDLNCAHLLQAMHPRVIRVRGDNSRSTVE